MFDPHLKGPRKASGIRGHSSRSITGRWIPSSAPGTLVMDAPLGCRCCALFTGCRDRFVGLIGKRLFRERGNSRNNAPLTSHYAVRDARAKWWMIIHPRGSSTGTGRRLQESVSWLPVAISCAFRLVKNWAFSVSRCIARDALPNWLACENSFNSVPCADRARWIRYSD